MEEERYRARGKEKQKEIDKKRLGERLKEDQRDKLK